MTTMIKLGLETELELVSVIREESTGKFEELKFIYLTPTFKKCNPL